MKSKWNTRAKKSGICGGAGGAILFVLIIVGLLALYIFVINPDIGEKYTGQRFMPEAKPLRAPAPSSDAVSGPVESSDPEAAAPPPPPDHGPGPRPIQSSTSGSMPIAESAIRQKLGSSSDVIYKNWSEPVETVYEGKKHWMVTVSAGVIEAGNSRAGRIEKPFTVYFRDGKVTHVEGASR